MKITNQIRSIFAVVMALLSFVLLICATFIRKYTFVDDNKIQNNLKPCNMSTPTKVCSFLKDINTETRSPIYVLNNLAVLVCITVATIIYSFLCLTPAYKRGFFLAPLLFFISTIYIGIILLIDIRKFDYIYTFPGVCYILMCGAAGINAIAAICCYIFKSRKIE